MTADNNTQIYNIVIRIDELTHSISGFNETVSIDNENQNAFIHSIFNNQAEELKAISKELFKLFTK